MIIFKNCDIILPVKNLGGVNMIKYNIYNLVVVFCNIGNGKIQCFICKEKRDKYVEIFSHGIIPIEQVKSVSPLSDYYYGELVKEDMSSYVDKKELLSKFCFINRNIDAYSLEALEYEDEHEVDYKRLKLKNNFKVIKGGKN